MSQTTDQIVLSVMDKIREIDRNKYEALQRKAFDLLFEVAELNGLSKGAIIDLLNERSKVGIEKYGTTLYESGLTEKQCLQHALEEACDLSIYLEYVIGGDK